MRRSCRSAAFSSKLLRAGRPHAQKYLALLLALASLARCAVFLDLTFISPGDVHNKMASVVDRRAVFRCLLGVGTMGVATRQPVLAITQPSARVVDTRGLLGESASAQIQELSSKLEQQTGLKLYVVSQAQKDLSQNLAELKKTFGVDSSSVLITIGPDASRRPGGLLGVTRGSKIDDRFKYRFTSAYDGKVEKTFGKTNYVDTSGYDKAAVEAARHMAACLTLVSTSPDSFECGAFLLSSSRLDQILASR
eukprot:TRINITY_DN123415_c0_g1_i1.p1 TRINITY_DN123415_c0_g1~~TRINITY_DN123415_c0_g1_i1.p1  ORF type:complete len:276 (+),score=26.88 TRINITY_DN123415_c0_g1_i1:78-830(+)